MIDLTKTITPKTDQLNFDNFIGGQSLTIKVTKVSILGEKDQPIAIGYEGDNGRPFKPCLSMRRVLVHCWGPDGTNYIGRVMTLYGDPKVKFGGADVGGIRISHLSHISEPITIALTASKAVRKPYMVRPLEIASKPQQEAAHDPLSQQQEPVEYISVDAQTLFEDMLKDRPENLKKLLLQKAGCISLATMPAEKYTAAMAWLTAKTEAD
jgi:hypothetical protein